MWTRLVILLLLLTAASVAENPLEDYQRAVTLHHWEEARDTWSKTDGSLGLLMRVDYHQARNEKDLAWVLLSQVEPRGLNGPEKGYFYLLRANSEYLLYKYELVRRNLAALDAMDEVDQTTRLRSASLRAVTLGEDQTRERQELIHDLPRHELREPMAWSISALFARKDERWSDSSMCHESVCRWAEERGELRFLVAELTRRSRLLSAHDQRTSLCLLERAVQILESLEVDVQPEVLSLVPTVSDSNLVRAASPKLMELRGRLLRLSPSGRARWALVGGQPPLPAEYDRTRLLLSALGEAESAEDYLPAAWLSLALAERVFTNLDNRWDYVKRARDNLLKLRAVYPGYNPFDGVSIPELDATHPWSKGEEELIAPQTLQQEKDAYIHRASDFEQVEESAQLLVDRMERESSDATGHPDWVIPLFTAAFESLSSNLRSWDPDLLRSTDLKEPTPAHEVLRREILKRPALLSRLLRSMDMNSDLRERDYYGRFFYHLGRFEEAERAFQLIEREALEVGDAPLCLEALEFQLRCAVRTGRSLSSGPLDRLHEALAQREMDENSFRLLSAVELLIVGGRLEGAREQLDRILADAESSPERLRQVAVNSVFIHRAMVGRMLGEPTETTLGLLKRGEDVSSADRKNWGWQVNLAYRAAILADEGRTEEFVEAYQPFLEHPFYPGTSRLQLQRRYAEAMGKSVAEARDIQRQSFDRYMARGAGRFRDLPILARVEPEVVGTETVPPATEIFRSSLTPYKPARETSRRRRLGPAQFFQLVGELMAESEGERGYLLPLQRQRLQGIQQGLADGAVLYHPILLPNRVVKLEIRHSELAVEEFFLDGDEFRGEMERLRALCSYPGSSLSEIEEMTAPVKSVLWSSELESAKEVWLLTPRPLDSVPWPLISGPECYLHWTDGDMESDHSRGRSGPILLAGDHPSLAGSREEIALLQRLFPEAVVWQPESGLSGLRKDAKQASIIHLTGHGEAVTELGEGKLDLGPIQIGLEDLFGLELQNRPLVVLATCEGGTGYQTREGRRFSLVTPFRADGASAVMANIWALDDRRSVEFFVRFYEAIQQGREPERALFELRGESVAAGDHPYYWSGLFLLRGLPEGSP